MTYIVITKPDCTFCDKAKGLLTKQGIFFGELKVNSKSDIRDPQMEILVARMSTFPMILERRADTLKLIGGADDLEEHLLHNKPSKDLFDGNADARQSESDELSDGERLFRNRYRKMTADELALHDQIKSQANEMAELFYQVAPINKGHVPDREKGANVQLAIRHLEDAVYRAVKALTA
ncbi:MAG: glutaredoxin [Roseibium sp.]|nr:glutaredoxin [Roseibium sp.]